MQEPSSPPPPPRHGTPRTERLKALLAEYGGVAVVVWFTLFALTWVGFAVAIRYFGFQPRSTGGETGLWMAAYVATQLTKPLRIAATFVLTPLVAKLVEWVWRRRPPAP